ncbi:MAG TPA: serine/threonine-protein kinase, partial [Pseudonocardiaceae bacterium]|nr:serine/threonine-protein kinase [Pseudonocardiaceae bacterium]
MTTGHARHEERMVGGLAALIGSLLSWLHQFPPNMICPGGWPWTVTLAGFVLAASPALGAGLVALVRKVTGNDYSGPVVVCFALVDALFGFVVPWLSATLTSNVFQSAFDGSPIGLSGADVASLNDKVCFFGGLGRQVGYLGGGQTVYEVLTSPRGNTFVFGIFLTTLVIIPVLCVFLVILQQRKAMRGGPRWPGRLMWLPFAVFGLATIGLQARLMAHLWLGFLPGSLLGLLLVALLGQPSWSVLNRDRAKPPPPPEPYRQPVPTPPPPAPPVARRPLTPTLVASDPPPAGQRLANTPGPAPFLAGAAAPVRWNSANGRFRRVRQLGHGGFGTVWLAVDTQLDRTVALKLAHAPDAQARQRMLREARALAAVHHPHCVRVYDIVEDTDGLGIVMEYIEGHPLTDVVGQGPPLDDPAAARLWSTMADALSAAHRKQVLHRDVKPANVILDLDGAPHLIDFGIARARGDVTLTAAGMMLGTPDFLAPETAASGVASPASDAWQLAATVSYALTGQPPRGYRSNPMSALMAAAQKLPNTHLPERSGHRELLRAALDPDPARRPT